MTAARQRVPSQYFYGRGELVNQPDVSIIVPVYNAMPYIITCLSSSMEQSIGRRQVEVVAVDDGSTDGSGEQLETLAKFWDNLIVVHQENSDGPSRPRNVGLEKSTGRFVFFLDADDYLGPEALQRMVALADAESLDVVSGRRVSAGGLKAHRANAVRPRHTGIFAEDYDNAIQRSQSLQYRAMMQIACVDCKNLYRREFLDRFGIRFPEDINFGEDFHFGIRCVSRGRVGLVDDYDCYYDRLRDDGRNGTTLYGASEAHLEAVERELRLRQEYGDPSWDPKQNVRDALLRLTQVVFGWIYLHREADVRTRMLAQAQDMLSTWMTPRSVTNLPALSRVKLSLIQRGRDEELRRLIEAEMTEDWDKDTVLNGRVYAGYPYFQDALVGVPDDCYDVTEELRVAHHLAALSWEGSRLCLAGYAFIEHVDTVDVTTSLVLRDQFGRLAATRPVRPTATPGLTGACGRGRYRYELAGFEGDLDLADTAGGRALPPGQWSVFISVGARGITREVPLGGHRAVTAGSSPATVKTSFTKYGTLTLEVVS